MWFAPRCGVGLNALLGGNVGYSSCPNMIRWPSIVRTPNSRMPHGLSESAWVNSAPALWYLAYSAAASETVTYPYQEWSPRSPGGIASTHSPSITRKLPLDKNVQPGAVKSTLRPRTEV